jgi:hypothetical protein
LDVVGGDVVAVVGGVGVALLGAVVDVDDPPLRVSPFVPGAVVVVVEVECVAACTLGELVKWALDTMAITRAIGSVASAHIPSSPLARESLRKP